MLLRSECTTLTVRHTNFHTLSIARLIRAMQPHILQWTTHLHSLLHCARHQPWPYPLTETALPCAFRTDALTPLPELSHNSHALTNPHHGQSSGKHNAWAGDASPPRHGARGCQRRFPRSTQPLQANPIVAASSRTHRSLTLWLHKPHR